jgi:hypothetical protein
MVNYTKGKWHEYRRGFDTEVNITFEYLKAGMLIKWNLRQWSFLIQGIKQAQL